MVNILKKLFLFHNFDKILGQNAHRFNHYISTLLADIGNKSKGYTLDTANRLYMAKKFALKQAYLKIIESHFAGQLRQVDFAQAAAVVEVRNIYSSEKRREEVEFVGMIVAEAMVLQRKRSNKGGGNFRVVMER